MQENKEEEPKWYQVLFIVLVILFAIFGASNMIYWGISAYSEHEAKIDALNQETSKIFSIKECFDEGVIAVGDNGQECYVTQGQYDTIMGELAALLQNQMFIPPSIDRKGSSSSTFFFR